MVDSSIYSEEPLCSIPKKSSNVVRYVSFNVNGVNTLFNYHPWTKLNKDYDLFFQALGADIITLQELKVSAANISNLKNIGHLTGYRSFISLPQLKKGYSGVGLFVRIPTANDSTEVSQSLTVVRAEEGISGYLKATNACNSYRDSDDSIGGYPEIDEETGLHLDSEGRCVVIELASNVVVFALYCPANSMGSDVGEAFRLSFLKNLLERAHNLKFKHGKEVIIMGDINVCLDLIDSAEGISDRVKQSLVVPATIGSSFESLNYEECVRFKASTPARTLLNEYTIPGLKYVMDPPTQNFHKDTQFLYDTTRVLQGREMSKYTVWNTLTSARSSNFGSRIDLILCSCEKMIKQIVNADILPYILGSDHCPIFTDFEIGSSTDSEKSQQVLKKLGFEAKLHFKLSKSRDISNLFSNSKRPLNRASPSPQSTSSEENPVKKPKLQYTSRKAEQASKDGTTTKPNFTYVSRKQVKKPDSQQSIKNFFVKPTSET